MYKGKYINRNYKNIVHKFITYIYIYHFSSHVLNTELLYITNTNIYKTMSQKLELLK